MNTVTPRVEPEVAAPVQYPKLLALKEGIEEHLAVLAA